MAVVPVAPLNLTMNAHPSHDHGGSISEDEYDTLFSTDRKPSPRKRQRIEQEAELSPSGKYTAPSRDPLYYYDDADCVLRVEDTLFRVCGILLLQSDFTFA